MSQRERKETDRKPAKAKVTAAKPSAEETHVPVEAENIEHTLRRLFIEKQKARKGNFGLYR